MAARKNKITAEVVQKNLKDGKLLIKNGRKHIALIINQPVAYPDTPVIEWKHDHEWLLELKELGVSREFDTPEELTEAFNRFVPEFNAPAEPAPAQATKEGVGRQFQAGRVYTGTLSCNSSLVYAYTVLSVSASRKSMMIQERDEKKAKRKKIYQGGTNGNEYVLPDGQYSGCPVLTSDDYIKEEPSEAVAAETPKEPLLKNEKISFKDFLKSFKNEKFLARFRRAYDKAPLERREAFGALPEEKKIEMFRAKYFKERNASKEESKARTARIIERRRSDGQTSEEILDYLNELVQRSCSPIKGNPDLIQDFVKAEQRRTQSKIPYQDIEALKKVIEKRKERGCNPETINLLLQNKIDVAATEERKRQLLEILAAETVKAPTTPECRQMDSIIAVCETAQGNHKQSLLTIECLRGIKGVDNKIKFHVKQTPAPYKMRLKVARFRDTCSSCGEEIPRGATMAHEKRTGCFCPGCAPSTVDEVRHYREQKARAKAERLEGWAKKREDQAEATIEGNRGDHAYNTQPGYVPGRERGNQQDRRAFESLNKAAEMRGRAHRLRSASPVKGDAERRRQAKREENDKVIFEGSRVYESCFGAGVVVRKNKKTYTVQFDRGATRPRDKSYFRLEP